MRIVAPMLSMLIVGTIFGGGGMTLYWSGQMDRQFKTQAEWKSIADKQAAVIKKQGDTIMEQTDALRKLTAATDHLLAATRTARP